MGIQVALGDQNYSIVMYDVAIIGGGLAGLATAIQMADLGRKVILFEKKTYPFHRVCGEYISMESWDFLARLGLKLIEEQLPKINQLNISSPSGSLLSHTMSMGGFGISRFKLDEMLALKAVEKGVVIMSGTAVSTTEFVNDHWEISANNTQYHSRMAIGSFGKRSNLDVQQKRNHTQRKSKSSLSNYIAVKYHIKADLPSDVIELHNFDQGYCGISKIEDDRYCMCYLTTTDNLSKCGKDIDKLEKSILSKNPHLNRYFSEFEKIYDSPLSIAQIDFSNKKTIEQGMPMIGDAAGMIAPLCGNGMSMALRGSTLLAPLLDEYLSGKIALNTMHQSYEKLWKKEFSSRLRAGRLFQSWFGNRVITEGVIQVLRRSPYMMGKLVSLTHGQPF